MSDRARAILKFPLHEELSLASVESVLDPDDIGQLRAAIAAATEAHLSRVDYRIRLSGGRVRWISAAGRRESSPSGQPSRLTGVCVNVTDRKEREEVFRIHEARLAAGAKLAGLGFYEVGDRLQVTWADDNTARICGTSPGATDTLLQFWLEHLHEDDRARVLDQYNALNDGRLEEVLIEAVTCIRNSASAGSTISRGSRPGTTRGGRLASSA